MSVDARHGADFISGIKKKKKQCFPECLLVRVFSQSFLRGVKQWGAGGDGDIVQAADDHLCFDFHWLKFLLLFIPATLPIISGRIIVSPGQVFTT